MNKDPIELMRKCVGHERGMRILRESLGIGLYKGWQQQCLAKVADMIEQQYLKLPLDADGVPISPGDYMALGDSRGEVIALTYTPGNSMPWEMQLEDGEWYITQFTRHIKPDTVESLLEDFAQKMNENIGMYTAEVIESDELERLDEKTIAKYAEKIKAVQNE